MVVFFVFILTVLVVIYIIQTHLLSRKVTDLEYKLMSRSSSKVPEREHPIMTKPVIAQQEKKEQITISIEEPIIRETILEARPESIPPETIAAVSTMDARPHSRSREEWEALIGGKLLNRIGALALTIGIGFFLKYAFDNNWITETMRVLIGIGVGLTTLLCGQRAHTKGYQIFAQGLVGAGISILYLSVYASFNFYHLVPQWIAFVMMSIVTAITFFNAFRYDSPAISLLGWAGGFLTPLLLSTGEANEVGLFGYITVLDIGLLGILLKKYRWVILEPLTLSATYLFYLIWYIRFYTQTDLLLTVFFLILFWALFYILDVIHIHQKIAIFPGLRHAIAALNTIIFYSAIYSLINPEHHEWMGLITVGIGVIYFFTVVVLKKRIPGDVMIEARYILTAIVLLILATTIQFCGYTTVIWWSVEAVLLLFLGIRFRLAYVWRSALGLLGFALIKLLSTENTFAYQPIADYSFIVNDRVLAFSVLAAMLGAGILIVKRLEDTISLSLQTVLHTVWCILLFILFTVEINDYFRLQTLNAASDLFTDINFTRTLILAGIWTTYSLVLVSCGIRRNVTPLVITGLSIFAIAIILGVIRGLVFQPIDTFTPILNLRFAVLLFIIATAQIESFLARKKTERYEWLAGIRVGLQLAASLVGFVLLTVETRDYFTALRHSIPNVNINELTFDRSMVLTVMWATYSLLLVWMGIRRKISSDVILGLCVMALAVLLGVIWGIEYEPIQKYLLVVNIRFFMMSFLIVILVYNARWLKNIQQEYPWANKLIPLSTMIIILIGFCLITVETIDAFRKMIVDFQQMPDRIKNVGEINRIYNLEQLTLSGIWLVYSILLIAAGIWRRSRIVRVAAIVFFGLSILKIFIYDLSFLETLYRIFSFIGLGVILLIVSFLYQRFKSIILGSEVRV